MAKTAYMNVTGAQQGPIRSTYTAQNHAGSFPLTTFSYGVMAASSAGNASFTPVTVTAVVDAFVKLLTAYNNGEALTVELQVTIPATSTLPEARVETTTLSGAKITRFQESMSGADDNRMELAFSFTNIQIVRASDGLTFSK
jgi:type VI protein secretion system component Hcp